MRRHGVDWLKSHPLVCFLLLGASFVVFALLSLNLAYLLQSNVSVWLAVGWQAVMDGALLQLLELLLSGYGAMLAWMIFKLCEKLLLDRLTAAASDGNKEKS